MARYHDYKKGDKIRVRKGRKSSNGLNFEGITAMKVDSGIVYESNGNCWMQIRFKRHNISSSWRTGTVYSGAIEPDTEEQFDEEYSLTF